MKGQLERRILVNYRVDPDVLRSVLPAPFKPAVIDGYGIAGICLIRLRTYGVTHENAAHRIAVESGVYVPRRDTSSRLVALLGGRVFPGWQHRARFTVDESAPGQYRVEVRSREGDVAITVAAHAADRVMPGSVFATVEEASAFFREAPVGYSATPEAGVYDGVALTADRWAIAPLQLDEVRSSFFDRLPTAEPDSAFLMADLRTTWSPQPVLRATR